MAVLASLYDGQYNGVCMCDRQDILSQAYSTLVTPDLHTPALSGPSYPDPMAVVCL